MAKNGVIYILTNPSFPQFVKIGYADDVENRVAMLIEILDYHILLEYMLLMKLMKD